MRTTEEVPLLRQIRVRHVRGDEYMIRLRGHELHTDQPEFDQGVSPVELFMASLATCAAHYAGRFLRRHELSLDGLSVLAEYGMADHPARVGRIRLTIDPPYSLTSHQATAMRAVVSNCTVHNTLRRPPEVEIRIGEEER
ncbi:hypothetical protein Lesp02_00060 [Lentzea sp. NBRC 105346]|uniref:OsmC family protein n=1 Tax=Lentzea sp. NBRC 105346 TaxID=3032205 RepID=UPI0024A5EF5D|nr:OsmC family protein [Lentzea sp. NBRC 105346]GLZ27816.1 hypothetical protein Lesp02_00060 [Lentzea sp. NBRC 105346]